jgi:hypothetical protein
LPATTAGPGIAWVLFAPVVALLPFLPIPTFTFAGRLTGLIAGILLLLVPSPFAFQGNRALRRIALPLGLAVGVFNAALHISSSFYFRRWMPGVHSSAFLFAAAIPRFAQEIIPPRRTPCRADMKVSATWKK